MARLARPFDAGGESPDAPTEEAVHEERNQQYEQDLDQRAEEEVGGLGQTHVLGLLEDKATNVGRLDAAGLGPLRWIHSQRDEDHEFQPY